MRVTRNRPSGMVREVSFRRARFPCEPVVVPLVLTAAVYEPGTWVELSFDRPIDIGAIDGSAITIDDGDMAIRFIGVPGAVITGPATMRI